MQPPLINEPLYLQIQRLKGEATISNLKTTSGTPATLPAYTLEEQFSLWIDSLTPAQLERQYTTLEVIKLASLNGKYRSTPALQDVAQLLRKHGFEHRRSWTNKNRNQRYWLHARGRE